MRAVIWVCVALSVVATGAAAAPKLKELPKKDLPLLGEWEVVRTGPVAKGERLTITFTPDGKLKYNDGRTDPEWGWYKADPGRDPPELDHATPAVANPANKRKPYLGIYRLDGDTLTIHCAESARPAAFDAPPGSGVMRLTLKRVKKD